MSYFSRNLYLEMRNLFGLIVNLLCVTTAKM